MDYVGATTHSFMGSHMFLSGTAESLVTPSGESLYCCPLYSSISNRFENFLHWPNSSGNYPIQSVPTTKPVSEQVSQSCGRDIEKKTLKRLSVSRGFSVSVSCK